MCFGECNFLIEYYKIQTTKNIAAKILRNIYDLFFTPQNVYFYLKLFFNFYCEIASAYRKVAKAERMQRTESSHIPFTQLPLTSYLHNHSEIIETFHLFKSTCFYFEECFKVSFRWILYIFVQFIPKYLIFLVGHVNVVFFLPWCPLTDCLYERYWILYVDSISYYLIEFSYCLS